MIFEQFYLGCLAHASYLIGSEGMAAVIDPQRDIELYLAAAREHDLKIAHVIETHLHADFVSGHRELAERTGAIIYLGEGSGATLHHRAVRDGDKIAFGKCRLKVLQTPGHTVESICLVVTDLDQGSEPQAVLTGDTLFIGDVGRPDLSDQYTPRELAGLLYDSLHQKLLTLPDNVLVYPAHGAGSMCGRNISADRSSTIGRERQFNYALRFMSRDEFVSLMTEDLPARPEYFQRDVSINREGAPALASLPPIEAITPREADRMRLNGITILDTRAANQFCSGHVPQSINIGLGGQFAAWAGSVIGLDRELILVAEDRNAADEARNRLARVGIERVAGFIEDGVTGWVRAGYPLESTDQISVQELQAQLASNPDLRVVDVRRPPEWNAGHIKGAVLHPLDRLRHSFTELDPTDLLAVHCKSGYRSAIACSLLQAEGFTRVINVLGGFDAWSGAGFPVAQVS
jgi:glyoxylase-like metal-dependent hydrolase (beta-lactamase superfamily II)